MSTQFGFRTPPVNRDTNARGGSTGKSPDPNDREPIAHTAGTTPRPSQTQAFRRDLFLNQIADQARQFTNADSTVIALRQSGPIVCVARSGPIGPPPGAQLDSRSGISGAALRQRKAFLCKDSETDSSVDAEVCRRLGIRSLAVVPVFEGAEVAGLIEVFASRPNAFQDEHVSMLEQLASLIAGSKAQTANDSVSPVSQASAVFEKSDAGLPQTSDAAVHVEGKWTWPAAFRLHPYQIAIVIGFLLLDVATVYWWKFR